MSGPLTALTLAQAHDLPIALGNVAVERPEQAVVHSDRAL